MFKTQQLKHAAMTQTGSSGLQLPRELTESVMHCKPGAATTLVTVVYEFLTNRPAKDEAPIGVGGTFDDLEYQASLPS